MALDFRRPGDVLEGMSGMITMDQANAIASGSLGDPNILLKGRNAEASAGDLAALFENAKANTQISSMLPERITIADKIYRVFNPISYQAGNISKERRVVILGSEGATVEINLFGKHSEMADLIPLERGDRVLFKNLSISKDNMAISTNSSSSLNRLEVSKIKVISDFSSINEDTKNVDIVFRVVEIGAIRHIERINRSGQIAVCECAVSDGALVANASFWGSSAIATARMKLNSAIKLEFASVKDVKGTKLITANEYSRVISNDSFSKLISSRT